MAEPTGAGGVNVVIQKISGETVEIAACLEDTVKQFKDRVAQSADVPGICQRLVLHDVSKRLVFERTAPHFTREMERLLEGLESFMYAEVRALQRPPALCHKCVVMILQLISASPGVTLRSASGAEPWKDRSWEACSWRDCKTMLSNYWQLRSNLSCILQSLQDGSLKAPQVKAAKSTLEELGGASAPLNLRRISVCCQHLSRFALAVLKFYDEGQQFVRHRDVPYDHSLGSVELRDSVPLSTYVVGNVAPEDAGAGARLQVDLLVDLEPAFDVLAASAGGRDQEEQIRAIRALGDLGGSCPDRTLGALIKGFEGSGHNSTLGKATLESLKKAIPPSAEAAAHFLAALPTFTQLEQAIQAAVHLGPDNPVVWDKIAQGLIDGKRAVALEAWKELEPRMGAQQANELLLQATFKYQNTAITHDCMGEALRMADARDHSGLVQGLAAYFAPTQHEKLSQACTCACLLGRGEDESLVAAMTAALDYSHGETLIQVAESLLRLCPESRPRAVQALCRELPQAAQHDRTRLLEKLGQLAAAADAAALRGLVAHLLKCENRLRQEGDWSLVEAVRISKRCDSVNRHGTRRLMLALARRSAYPLSGLGMQRQAARHLQKLASEERGVEQEVLVELSSGLRCQNEHTRKTCCRLFAGLPKEPRLAAKLLLEILQGDEPAWAKQAATDLLGLELRKAGALEELQPNVEDIKAALLQAADAPQLALRSAALACLKPLAHDEAVRRAAEKHLEDDGIVQLEAMKLLAEAPAAEVPRSCWLRGLRSSSTEVVAVTLRTLISSDGGSEEGEEELSKTLAPLLLHLDEEVAVAAAQALGYRKAGGRPSAVTALAQKDLWPERRGAVLRAREEALQALEASQHIGLQQTPLPQEPPATF